MKFSAVIVAAGFSTRMNLNKNKTMLPINDKPLFMKSVEAFVPFTDDIIVVLDKDNIEEGKKYHSNVVLGGLTRQESVHSGILAAKYDTIMIHDGARPYISSSDINTLVDSFDGSPTFIGNQVVNSLKSSETFEKVDRTLVVEAYTPQMVLKNDYLYAFDNTTKTYTDDVTLVTSVTKEKIKMVNGSSKNIKITTYNDYTDAVKYFESEQRIGQSFDIHRLVEGRPLILGGIEIPYEKGLLGHSDADALLHAISEALLGSLAFGDLGKYYPDNSEKTLGMDSKIILKECYEMIKKQGYTVINIDTMIFAEEPKMAPHIMDMRQSIASVLGINVDAISIKATTFEHLGSIGSKEAIGASAVVLVRKGGLI